MAILYTRWRRLHKTRPRYRLTLDDGWPGPLRWSHARRKREEHDWLATGRAAYSQTGAPQYSKKLYKHFISSLPAVTCKDIKKLAFQCHIILPNNDSRMLPEFALMPEMYPLRVFVAIKICS